MQDDQKTTAIQRCRDGFYRGCDFMGCDDVNVQVVEHGRQVAPCRLHGPPVPPHIMGRDTTEPLIVRQWRAGYFGEPSHPSSRLRALRELDSGSRDGDRG